MTDEASQWLRDVQKRRTVQEEHATRDADLAWLRSLRADTNDTRAAEGITPQGIIAYLTAYGWEKAGAHDRHPAEFWQHPTYRIMKDLMVPLDPSYADYRRRVLGLAKALAGHSRRGLFDVLLDLRQASR